MFRKAIWLHAVKTLYETYNINRLIILQPTLDWNGMIVQAHLHQLTKAAHKLLHIVIGIAT